MTFRNLVFEHKSQHNTNLLLDLWVIPQLCQSRGKIHQVLWLSVNFVESLEHCHKKNILNSGADLDNFIQNCQLSLWLWWSSLWVIHSFLFFFKHRHGLFYKKTQRKYTGFITLSICSLVFSELQLFVCFEYKGSTKLQIPKSSPEGVKSLQQKTLLFLQLAKSLVWLFFLFQMTSPQNTFA